MDYLVVYTVLSVYCFDQFRRTMHEVAFAFLVPVAIVELLAIYKQEPNMRCSRDTTAARPFGYLLVDR